ncbi:GntR family transcriptional regulator [Streptomyces sp. DSM 44915]|uniref:GntR family transcriptional regulator n=1 Tax=Streptomyces chisholmiae TaxID=3075540 RepID=A0ABU2JN55_9ACTN|nr:GntR family transcriptional regulator [Streptomyces sp. DSM 44915]MDT0266332.1 GntR family transcriptional regulator [Streptomyces sp. DSM 44915]
MESTRTESAISGATTLVGRPRPRSRSALAARRRPPPTRHSVRAQVLAALRDALAAGELTPGQTYSAPLLAERYGVSATPVREAMQQLTSEGLVETVPNRGFRVAGRSPRDVAELAEVRAALEVPALLRLARTLPAERFEELRPLAEATVGAAALGDVLGYAEADRRFHRELLWLTGNRQLVAVAEELHRKAQCPAVPGGPPGSVELLAEARQHGVLLDALGRGDIAATERLAHAHLVA